MTETSEQYDIVGDVHGCGAELETLLAKLGYGLEGDVIRHADQRRFIFLGDLVDRGPDTVRVLR
ncbi:MAG: metallophosphoesterase, partial [Geodermatophilaceae bacterium]|nr:metallophosphoesterase [Geodermatophilaceae bacterium]